MAVEEMEELVAGLGDQLRWSAAQEIGVMSPSAVHLVVGMGGSGISGDIAAALASGLVLVHKGYGLPTWARTNPPAVIAISYSGNTEETLSATEEAHSSGFPIYAITSGGQLAEMASSNGWPLARVPAGLQPRAALGYMLGTLLRWLESAGAVSLAPSDLTRTADLVDSLARPGGMGWALAADLAAGLKGRAVIIYGATGLTAPAALRWKTQINENGKWPAWVGLLPEVDHNEIVSWASLADVTQEHVGIVTLRDESESTPVTARFDHTARLTSQSVPWVGEVWSQGVSPLERMMSLCAMGDLVSIEIARAAGVDPMPVEVIEKLKGLLAEESG
ncbi:MAG TPA: bifunctional phosphoglucose/phosphomannose isomerase [Acidimicrobiia bacterium]|jgi:glucose/mannose-6-phosphate isomerase|nr:bifunctional phosphoglucose/phosphomannose isomerase [Acidimicrobiia bacterium]